MTYTDDSMYHLTLKRADSTGAVTVIANVSTQDETVMAATLRAAADRLDPPQPARPAYRGRPGTPSGDLAIIAAAEALDASRNAETSGPYTWDTPDLQKRLRGGEVLPPTRNRDIPVEYLDDNSPRIATPAQIDAMVCPDCTDDEHTYELGRCALPPPQWGGRGRCPEVHPEDGRQCIRVAHPVDPHRHRALPVNWRQGQRRTDADRWVTPSDRKTPGTTPYSG